MIPVRHRVALVLLPVALVAGGWLLWRTAPTDRDLVIDLGDPAAVRRIAVTYWRADAPDERGGFSRTFAASPPQRIRQPVSLRMGEHLVEVRVERFTDGARSDSTVTRHVSITGNDVVVFGPAPEPQHGDSAAFVGSSRSREPALSEPHPPK